jgi:phosphoserine phosphatase RsbU/P
MRPYRPIMGQRYRDYALLLAVFAVTAGCQIGSSVAVINNLRFATERAREPMEFGFRMRAVSGIQPEATKAGIHWGDLLEKVGGQPFTGENVLRRAVSRLRPGDLLPVVVRRPDGAPLRTSIKLAPDREAPPTLAQWLVTLALEIAFPLFCLCLGFWVAAVRPADPLAWLLLGLLTSLSAFVLGPPDWEGLGRGAFLVWSSVASNTWPIWMLLFGIYFPERAPEDRKLPWLKWVLIVPQILWVILYLAFVLGRELSFDAIAWMRPLLFAVYTPERIVSMLAVSAFFFLLGRKSGTASTPDARRRLKILWLGASVSLTPSFIVVLISLVRDTDPFRGLPDWVVITTLLALTLFPATLAYLIVVHRAMEVRVVLRQGLQYALARGGIRALQFLATAVVTFAAAALLAGGHSNRPQKITTISAGIAVVFLARRAGDRLRAWTDRRFFREAYSAEQVLSELSEEARKFVETRPLLETVTQRVSETLHVPHAAVLLESNGRYCVAQAVGGNPPPESCLPAGARSIEHLRSTNRPAVVYFDDPRSWLQQAPPEEQDRLKKLDAQLLLPMAGRERLLGVMVLGPKRSQEPYSRTDLHLLQSVATQTGLALENSELLAAMAIEVAQRERLNREIEIAREVQERLFPQEFPPIAGIDYCGRCRPAQAVGGDYYDFVTGAHSTIKDTLGIAIGDVSGKGISAALLMASLQASLRGQSIAGVHDLAALMHNINLLVHEASAANRYATFFYGEYHLSRRRLEYVNAGHNPPMVLRGDQVIRLEAGGPVVGLLKQARYQQTHCDLEPGDVVIAFTDGVSEAMTAEGEEWGEERFIKAAQECRQLGAPEIITRLMAGADAFAAGAPQHDDMTLVVVKVEEIESLNH